jgi:LmbE family N-acetylglucosaminyl deacetylase
VDHRIVRRAGEASGQPLAYYEEFPYAQDPQAVRAALGEGQWRAAPVPLSEKGLEAKIAAIACYRSQLSTWWADLTDMETAVRAFAERYWVLGTGY